MPLRIKTLRADLQVDLIEQVKSASPSFFERLVVDLLLAMGYGGSRQDAGRAIGKSGDGGIDGIIKEDKLGLDVIYIQAKRWRARVGRPEVQKFAGALQGHRASKGVFITTSSFTREAEEYANAINTKLILINGAVAHRVDDRPQRRRCHDWDLRTQEGRRRLLRRRVASPNLHIFASTRPQNPGDTHEESAAAIAALALACAFGAATQAQTWPSKPIKIVVNFPPGGAADQIARSVAAPLQTALGQTVVVENRAGSGGNIGGDAVAKSPPDGYTLLMSSGGMVSVNPHIYARMPFDPAKDLVPVAAAARVLVFLVVRTRKPVEGLQGLPRRPEGHPGQRSFGSPGNGSSPHLATEMMKAQTGTFAVHVPYRGAAPALTDLLGGQLDFLFDPGIAIPHVRSGKLRMIAVGSPQRSPLFPDVPTLDELGLKGFDADTVFGFYAPAGTPEAVITRLNTEINRILATPALKERITALGGVPAPMSPAEFAAKAAEDSKRFGAIIRNARSSATEAPRCRACSTCSRRST